MVQVHPVFIGLYFFNGGGGAFVIIPKTGRNGALLVFFYFVGAVPDVKETSSGRAGDPS